MNGKKVDVDRFDDRLLKGICLVHGDLERATALKADLVKRRRAVVEIPARGQKVDL